MLNKTGAVIYVCRFREIPIDATIRNDLYIYMYYCDIHVYPVCVFVIVSFPMHPCNYFVPVLLFKKKQTVRRFINGSVVFN